MKKALEIATQTAVSEESGASTWYPIGTPSLNKAKIVRLPRAKRPHIYGDETKCRGAVARYMASGQELVDQVPGVRNRIAQAKAMAKERKKPEARATAPSLTSSSVRLVFRPLKGTEIEDVVASDWSKGVRSWNERAMPPMGRYLQDQFTDVLPALAAGAPRTSETLLNPFSLRNAEPWLREAVAELRQLQAVLGVQRAIAIAAPSSTRFAELHRSGLVDEKVVRDHEKRMAAPRTARQLSDSIGSPKELTEATLRGALTQLGERYTKEDELPKLMRKWRGRIGALAPPDPAGRGVLDSANAALANLVTFLAAWRNAYGSGHGRTKYPPGLKARHARLAADAAETCIRFIVTTMDDLQLLPP